jgi:hypothetical protein
MRVWKVKAFDRWARREGLSDDDLVRAAEEVARGQFEGDLGGFVLKKRVARVGGGKRGGFRTIIAYRADAPAGMFFLHGYAKSGKANITPKERIALQTNARALFGLSQRQTRELEREGAIVEIGRTT